MDADRGVRRRDTTKGPPLRILSLDGGGVRGYSMFIIIQELMHRTFVEINGRAPRRHEIPKPCDHFDLIVGTGTGGLIALMLGRLRLDLETCKELYVRMTRHVFETDKTIAGIPYRSTLFKASKLEEAIRQCAREHTIDETEGNDGTDVELINPLARGSSNSSNVRRHASNASTVSFSARGAAAQAAARPSVGRGGNPNARLYDARENRTKTAVTAMYKGSSKGAPPAMLRSYDSRREPPPEFDCKIWQAGRATCAIGLAFKPIQIGQSAFHDDGAGTFNPTPDALDEAVLNEWPGRDIGVLVSVGTGKRPRGSDANQQMWYEGFMGEFAEARRRLISKIEGCEAIHEYMLREHLPKRNVNVENYYRLNVEIGVGEFGMNEWHRLAEISTSTRRYMAREDEKRMTMGIASKLARIHKAKNRIEQRGMLDVPEANKAPTCYDDFPPLAVELPGDSPISMNGNLPPISPSPRSSYSWTDDQMGHTSPIHTATDRFHPDDDDDVPPPPPPPKSGPMSPVRTSHDYPDKLIVTSPTPDEYRTASGADKIIITSPDEQPRPLPKQQFMPPTTRLEPPPLPPKTPLSADGAAQRFPAPLPSPPYPMDDDEAPPPVNMARKPDYRG
ncbi:patatin-like serine hydrolase [Stachybotrys elegans]|uniref:Patatin-like serine hydrolase n=1 Tax=Stachybotrys elegans TaxID=80388 RepID=A0A8K0SQ26_9HYPO|nr:patatin-like serine hydrolase [Stachybotrys elegans]